MTSNLRSPAAPAAIAGSFADYRLIKSRGCLQIIIEIPVEAQAVAFDVLGYPMPGIEIPVAVARLNGIPADVVSPAQDETHASAGGDVAPDRGINRGASDALTPKARYAAMTAGEQARTRACRLPREDMRFRAWVADRLGLQSAVSVERAEDFIRDECCGGATRKLIATDPEALDKFIDLETRFLIDVGQITGPR